MDESELRWRLDAILLLLFASTLLLFAIAARFATASAVGVLVLVALIAVGHYRSG